MGFKIVDGKGRQPGRGHSKASEVAYYGKTAQFRLSPVAVAALGDPEKIVVHYDEESKAIGFTAATDEPQAITLRRDSPEAKSRYFGFRTFADLIGLGEDFRGSFELTDDGAGMLVASIVTA